MGCCAREQRARVLQWCKFGIFPVMPEVLMLAYTKWKYGPNDLPEREVSWAWCFPFYCTLLWFHTCENWHRIKTEVTRGGYTPTSAEHWRQKPSASWAIIFPRDNCMLVCPGWGTNSWLCVFPVYLWVLTVTACCVPRDSLYWKKCVQKWLRINMTRISLLEWQTEWALFDSVVSDPTLG